MINGYIVYTTILQLILAWIASKWYPISYTYWNTAVHSTVSKQQQKNATLYTLCLRIITVKAEVTLIGNYLIFIFPVLLKWFSAAFHEFFYVFCNIWICIYVNYDKKNGTNFLMCIKLLSNMRRIPVATASVYSNLLFHYH